MQQWEKIKLQAELRERHRIQVLEAERLKREQAEAQHQIRIQQARSLGNAIEAERRNFLSQIVANFSIGDILADIQANMWGANSRLEPIEGLGIYVDINTLQPQGYIAIGFQIICTRIDRTTIHEKKSYLFTTTHQETLRAGAQFDFRTNVLSLFASRTSSVVTSGSNPTSSSQDQEFPVPLNTPMNLDPFLTFLYEQASNFRF